MLSDIEKPLSELETCISKFSSFTERHDLDVGGALETLHDLMPQFERKLYANLSAWDIVQLARHPQRPFPLDYINAIFSDVIELHGDRHNADDQTIFGGFARLDSLDVMLIATRKGRNLKQNILCNFGCAMPEGFRKALRLMRLAEKARTPIITFVDTPGAFPGVASEERNVSEAIAMNLREMFRLTVPIICVITGEGGSGGALSIACGNQVLMLENAYYSVITPEGCAAILWHDDPNEAVSRAAQALHITARDLQRLDIVDTVVPEPLGGAHRNPEQAAELLRTCLRRSLAILLGLSPQELKQHRYNRFRAIGKFLEA